jgi:hypothetical protein
MKAIAAQPLSHDVLARKHKPAHYPITVLPATLSLPSPTDSRLIQRAPECACGGGCPRCAVGSHNLNLQTKLSVSMPGDKYEQEADRVADEVLRMPEHDSQEEPGLHQLSSDIGLQRKCDDCSSAAQDSLTGEEELVQRKESAAGSTRVRSEGARQIEIPNGSGQPLSTSMREFFEPRLGKDLGDVRVHDNSRAADSARAVKALAYTVGHDVIFGQGQYAPETIAGKKLLAHELTHTLQQSRRSPGESILQRKPDEGKDLPAKPPAPKPAASCPTFISLTATINTPKVSDSCKGQKCRLELGCCTTPRDTCGSTKDSGAAFKGTIDVPAGCTGELGFMQNIVSSNRKRTLTDKSNECVASTSPLADGGVPWKGCKISVATAGSHTVESDDCPFLLLLDNMTAASVKDSFKTFLIWKTGDKGWKTIGLVSWSWNASTTQKKGTDCASKWTAPGGSASTETGAASTEVPVTKPSAQAVLDKWGACEKKE